MKLAQKHAAISRGHIRIGFSPRAHAGKLHRRHDEEKLMIRFRQKNKFLALVATPACGNGDPVFIIDRMTKLTRVENFGGRQGIHLREEDRKSTRLNSSHLV